MIAVCRRVLRAVIHQIFRPTTLDMLCCHLAGCYGTYVHASTTSCVHAVQHCYMLAAAAFLSVAVLQSESVTPQWTAQPEVILKCNVSEVDVEYFDT